MFSKTEEKNGRLIRKNLSYKLNYCERNFFDNYDLLINEDLNQDK